MNKSNVTDIFFDLDHTLWDFEKNSALTFEKILEINKIAVPLASFLEVYVPINFEYWKLYREEKIDKESLRYQRLKKTFDALDLKVSDNTIANLANDYIRYLSTYTNLFPESISILKYLQPKYKLHIITNGFKEVQEKKLKNSGISHFFNHIINSESVGVKKPNPLIFMEALKRAGSVASNSVMIGDNLEADILGAQKVGIQTIHFNAHNGEKPLIGPSIFHLNEIKNLL